MKRLCLTSCAAVLMLFAAIAVEGAIGGKTRMMFDTTGPNPATHVAGQPNASFIANFFTGYAAARNGPGEAGILWRQAFGSKDIGGTVPMSENPRFPIASNTKLITAISLYQLQERGLVKLTDPVQKYLDASDMANFGQHGQLNWCPTVRGSNDPTCRNVTFVQLLEMQAGIPNRQLMQAFYPFPGSLGMVFSYYVNEQLVAEPGTQYYYSNPAYILCGYMIEKFSGMKLADYWRVNIFGVVGMTDTYFDVFNGMFNYDPRRVDEFNIFVDKVAGATTNGACSSEADLGFASAGGGIMGTPDDEAKLYYTLFNFSEGAMGKPLLQKPESLLAIVKPRTALIPGIFYGQGIYIYTKDVNAPIPDQVAYEGDMICPRTSNFFRIAKPGSNLTTSMMTQAWSSGVSYFVSQSTLGAAQTGQTGVFFEIIEQWERREGNNALAQGLMAQFI